jgi:preprotein translocase subunit SecG
MTWLTTLLIVVQVVSAIAVIVLVLLQHGKGADMGAAFGGGASGSLFGATGSANFLSRSTAAVATVFFLATLGLAYVGTATMRPTTGGGGIMDAVPVPAGGVPANTAPGSSAPKDIPVPTAPQGSAPVVPSAPAAASTPPASAPAATPGTTNPKPVDVPK